MFLAKDYFSVKIKATVVNEVRKYQRQSGNYFLAPEIATQVKRAAATSSKVCQD